MRLMIQNHIRSDSVRVAGEEAEETLYTEADMQACLDKIEVVDFHQVRRAGQRSTFGGGMGRLAGEPCSRVADT